MLACRCPVVLFEGSAYFTIGFIVGNATTSRMDALSVSSMTSRSMPMPMPIVGAHAIFHSIDEIQIERHRFFVACCFLGGLLFQSLSCGQAGSVNSLYPFASSATIGKQLRSALLRLIGAMRLSERRHLHRIVNQESGLYQA